MSEARNMKEKVSAEAEMAVLKKWLKNPGLRSICRMVRNLWKETGDEPKIVEIIGLDASQFTQTAMIAQGEFMRLLLAKSDERKEIFSRLFDTQVFSRMQRQLKERAKSMYGELADGQKAKERELSHLLYPKTVGFAGSAVNSEEEENPAQAVDPEYEKRIEEASGTEEILEIIEEMEQEIRAGESACIKNSRTDSGKV